MKKCIKKFSWVLTTVLLVQMGCRQEKNGIARILPFDTDWRFSKDSTAQAEKPEFDDSKWRILDIPHDWSIEDLPPSSDKTIGPFAMEGGNPRNGIATGHVRGGVGWYRNSFALEGKNKSIAIYFEGVYMESDVWVNGHYVGSHKHGYTSFWYDISKYCETSGTKNTVVVRVANRGKNSRWYSGSGIYRHVKLIVTNPLHMEPWGVYITTSKISDKEATVRLQTEVINSKNESGKLKIKTRLLDSENKLINTEETTLVLQSKDSATKVLQEITVNSPKLWSPESPTLYKAEVAIWLDDQVADSTTTIFGIRDIRFSATDGFFLNGKSTELKGGCVHHDNGILGRAAIDRAEERKVELLKANGFNAVRSGTYPPSEKFLEACDRLGLLAIDETFDMWQKPKTADDYHLFFDEWWERDISSMVLRDRNHASILFWGMGNEIYERADSSGVKIMKKLRAAINKIDTTRPLTIAVNGFWDHPEYKWSNSSVAFEQADVAGYNYQWMDYENDHKQYPKRIMMGTESVAGEVFENWRLVQQKPYVIGDFVWSAIDYLGESGAGAVYTSCDSVGNNPNGWPWFVAWVGDLDITGIKKPQSYYRDVVWSRSKIEMAVHKLIPKGCKEIIGYWAWPEELQSWTWPGNEGKEMSVRVFSRAPVVQLELNGKLVGKKTVSERDKLIANFNVPYEQGELKAFAIENNKKADSVCFRTASAPSAIRLKADRMTLKDSRNDLSYIFIELVDANNNINPALTKSVEISVSGGELAAFGNANPIEMRSFKSPICNTFRGRCLAIVRPTKAGNIILEAKSAEVTAAKITIKVVH